MASVMLSSPASASSPFERWHRHFFENRDSPGAFPWHDSYRLTASELRLLGRERIPRLTNHWLDRIFRRLRKLAGLEACAAVLVTAEVLAIPFYQALRDATGSPLLRAICVRILCDEAAHLNYQALTIGMVRQPLSRNARAFRS